MIELVNDTRRVYPVQLEARTDFGWWVNTRAGGFVWMLADYVIHTHPSEEALAQEEIQRAGFRATWLATREEQRTARGRRQVITSLFPSYIFAAFDVANDAWRSIVNLRGVRRILGSDPLRPYALPPNAVDELQARFDAGEFVNKPRQSPLIAVGARVVVDVGLDKPTIGVCKMSRGERIRVLMHYLGAEREIEVHAGRVRVLAQLVAA